MNPKPSQEITVQTLLALRKENDAVRLITERLRVKDMGPADHISTKHEVKAFIEGGSEAKSEALVLKSAERRQIGRKLSQEISLRSGQKFSP